MSAMLGLTRRATESFKTLNKQLGAAVWQAVADKPIWVFLAATMISAPCLAETPAVDRAKVATKLVSSGKMLGKDLDHGAVKRVAAKPGENGRVNSGAEGGSSSSETSAALSPKGQPVGGDVAKQDNGGANECGDYCGFYGWLPFIMAWPLLFGMKKTPNVQSNRRCAASSRSVLLTAGLGTRTNKDLQQMLGSPRRVGITYVMKAKLRE